MTQIVSAAAMGEYVENECGSKIYFIYVAVKLTDLCEALIKLSGTYADRDQWPVKNRKAVGQCR